MENLGKTCGKPWETMRFFLVFHWHMKDANQISVFNIFQATKNGGSSSALKNEQGVKSTWIPGTFWWMRTGENLPENNWVSSWLITTYDKPVKKSLMAHLLPSVCRNTIYNLEMFHIDRCFLEGAIQFCKPKLAVAFSFTLHIYAWYGLFFPPWEWKHESCKAQRELGAFTTNWQN